MIFELSKKSNNTLEYDYCICGAGVSGITLARKLAQAGKKVALFEAGGKEYSETSHDSYAGKSIGISYDYGIQGCRLRYLGGTSNHWAGRTMFLQPVDFEQRDFFELPGWPIAKSELDRFTSETFEILGLEENSLDNPHIPELTSSSMMTVGHGSAPPVRFGQKYYQEILDSENIHLYLNANLTDINLYDAHDRVKSIKVKNYKGESKNFTGRRYVLAMGAIENARLLLNNNKQVKSGIGNHSDFVGRCFMEHFQLQMGKFVINTDNKFWKKNRLEFFPTRDFVIKNKIGTSVISFGSASNATYGKMKELKKIIRDTVCASNNLAELSHKLVDFNCPGDGIITTLCEQAPNKESRVSLDKTVDDFGLNRVIVNWKMNELDKRTIRILAKETAKEFARLDFGRVQLPDYIIDDSIDIPIVAHCHQMGTTRMAIDKEYGVVDSNSKIFGIDNIYMAGSSIFSTGGGVNPTLSIVQLTLRLAEHLNTLRS